MSTNTPWWANLYDDLLADVLLERKDDAEVERTLSFLAQVLELTPGARLFDQCCGIGSLSIPLAQRSYEVVGFDLMPRYIERAQESAAQAGTHLTLHAADAFTFRVTPACDAGFNWWTSFGYAESDDANLQMLLRAIESLRPRGRFALDFMNVPGVLRHFQPRVELSRQTPQGEVKLLRESRVDLRTMAMHKRWLYGLPDGRQVEHPSWVRMYLPHELVQLFERAGFVDVALYGDLDRSALSLDSPRCIVVGSKPA